MNEIKQWFTFTSNSGADVDLNFNKKDTDGNFRIFVDGSFPDQVVFTKLFDSIPFKLNDSDIAKDSVTNNVISRNGNVLIKSGLVTLATNTEAKGTFNNQYLGDNGNIFIESRVPRVNQLPVVFNDVNLTLSNPMGITNTPNDIINVNVATSNSYSTLRNEFVVKASNNFVNWLNSSFTSIQNYVDNKFIYSETRELSGVKVYEFVANSVIQINKPVYIVSNGKVETSNNGITEKEATVIGFSRQLTNQNDVCEVIVEGILDNFTNLNVGNTYYLTSTGITDIKPTTIGQYLVKVGVALTSTKLLVKIDYPIIIS